MGSSWSSRGHLVPSRPVLGAGREALASSPSQRGKGNRGDGVWVWRVLHNRSPAVKLALLAGTGCVTPQRSQLLAASWHLSAPVELVSGWLQGPLSKGNTLLCVSLPDIALPQWDGREPGMLPERGGPAPRLPSHVPGVRHPHNVTFLFCLLIFRLDLRSFHLPYSRISLVPNVGLQVSISNAFAEVDGDWRVKFFFMCVPSSPSPCLGISLSGSGRVFPPLPLPHIWAAAALLPPDVLMGQLLYS